MIFKASRLKAVQEANANMNDDGSPITDTNNYKDLLGLSYNNNYANIIPTRFKWGRSLIKVVD